MGRLHAESFAPGTSKLRVATAPRPMFSACLGCPPRSMYAHVLLVRMEYDIADDPFPR